jgi:hypothetical protein
MHLLKRYMVWQVDQALGRQGQFWQHESFDHVIRDAAELGRIWTVKNTMGAFANKLRNWRMRFKGSPLL